MTFSSQRLRPFTVIAVLSVLLSSCTGGIAPSEPTAGGVPASARSPDESTFDALVASGAYGGLHLVGEIEEATGCPAEPAAPPPGCWWGPLGPVAFVSSQALPAPPDRLTARGSVVLGTHPRLGMVSRIDLASDDLWWSPIGIKPSDVTLSADGTNAFVSDEMKRSLLVVEPKTLEVLREIPLPAPAHSLAIAGADVWATLVGRNDLARIRGSAVRLYAAKGSPREVVIDAAGRVWFLSWGSNDVRILDPQTGSVSIAPEHVKDPHSLSLGADGTVWITDSGADAIVGFLPDGQVVRVPVGPSPGDIAFLDGRLAVALVGSGELVIVEGEEVVGRVGLGTGLGALASVAVPRPIADVSPIADIYEHHAFKEWALAPCAWGANLGLRVLCPGPQATLDRITSGQGHSWRGQREAPGYETGCPGARSGGSPGQGAPGYEVAYFVPGVPAPNHPSVIVEGWRGRWTQEGIQARFCGQLVGFRDLRTRTEIRRVIRYERGGGFHGGHTVLLWNEGGWAYLVSIHGHSTQTLQQVIQAARSLVQWPAGAKGADLGPPSRCRATRPTGLGPGISASPVLANGTIDVAGSGFAVGGVAKSVRLVWEPGRERIRFPGDPGVDESLPTEVLLAEAQGPIFCRRLRLPETSSGSYLVGADMEGLPLGVGAVIRIAP